MGHVCFCNFVCSAICRSVVSWYAHSVASPASIHLIDNLGYQVPETIYERDDIKSSADRIGEKKSLYRRLGFRTPAVPTGETWLQTFRRPYAMFVYPAVILPSFWFSVTAMTEVANTAGFALNFGATSRWHFNTAQVGFCFFSGIIGAGLGEIFGGPLCDIFAKRALKRGEVWKPEHLLHLVWTGLVTVSVNISTFQWIFIYIIGVTSRLTRGPIRLVSSSTASNSNTVHDGSVLSPGLPCSPSARRSWSPCC